MAEAGRRRLGAFLPWFARQENPIDPTGAAIQDPSLYRQCLDVLADEPHIGIIAVSQDSPAAFDLIAAKATAEGGESKSAKKKRERKEAEAAKKK